MTAPGAADPLRTGMLTSFPLTRLVDHGLDLGAAQRIVAAFTSGADWDAAASREADTLEELLPDAGPVSRRELRGRIVAARAVAPLMFGLDPTRRQALDERLGHSVADLAAETPGLETVRIPHGDGHMHGILVTPPTAAPPPCVILLGGLDKWGPAFLNTAAALAARGLATLVVELPGQGQTLRAEGLVADENIATAVSTCVDRLVASPAVGDRIGVWGNSFGALFAALAAAADDRIAACCVNGAPAAPTVPEIPPLFAMLGGLFGLSDPAALGEVLKRISLADRKITCPLLVLHGGADPLVGRSDVDAFLAAGTAGARSSEWADGEHTLYNHVPEREAVVGDWFVANLS